MFDGSHYPIEENVAKTKELVEDLHMKRDCLWKQKSAPSAEKKTELSVRASVLIRTSVRLIADLGVRHAWQQESETFTENIRKTGQD